MLPNLTILWGYRVFLHGEGLGLPSLGCAWPDSVSLEEIREVEADLTTSIPLWGSRLSRCLQCLQARGMLSSGKGRTLLFLVFKGMCNSRFSGLSTQISLSHVSGSTVSLSGPWHWHQRLLRLYLFSLITVLHSQLNSGIEFQQSSWGCGKGVRGPLCCCGRILTCTAFLVVDSWLTEPAVFFSFYKTSSKDHNQSASSAFLVINIDHVFFVTTST